MNNEQKQKRMWNIVCRECYNSVGYYYAIKLPPTTATIYCHKCGEEKRLRDEHDVTNMPTGGDC